jgi:hypothetical protein
VTAVAPVPAPVLRALLIAPGPALAAVLAVAPAAGQRPWLGALGGAGVALYLAGLAMPWPGALPWALGILGVEYLVSLEVRAAPLDLAAPAYAAGFFLCAELGWLGLEARRGGRPWPGRAAAVAVVALAGGALGSLLLLVAAAPVTGGALLTGVGVMAAVAIGACLAWLGRR